MTDANKKKVEISEYPVKCIRLGSLFGFKHFVISIIPTQKKGKIELRDNHELPMHTYEFDEKGINELKKFLEMIK